MTRLKNALIAAYVVLMVCGLQYGCVMAGYRAKICNKDWHALDGHWYTCAWSMRDD